MIKFIFIVLIAIGLGAAFSVPLSSLLSLYNANQSAFFQMLSTPFTILNNFFNSVFNLPYITTLIFYFLVIALFFFVLNFVFRGGE